MRSDQENLNLGWHFSAVDGAPALDQWLGGEPVTLPHNALDLPLTYADETSYQRPFLYQRRLEWRPEFEGREVTLILDGAMADTHVYLNGRLVAAHRDGYTPVYARLTDALEEGDNVLSVTIDGSENPDIPPFGGQIDYLTYAGLYRDAWLRVTDPISIANAKVEVRDPLAEAPDIAVAMHLSNPRDKAMGGSIHVLIRDEFGSVLAEADATILGETVHATLPAVAGLDRWSPETPILYAAEISLKASDGSEDRVSVPFGVRDVRFTPDGFLLNGKRVFLKGLNRHQSYPYVGYAMGRRAQERDAEILRNELHCNVVRASHYPMSPWFLDACDRLGLMVLEEIPGWQHIGGPVWREEACHNVRRMIERDWNHPSIIGWGVRINESADHRDFYKETNRIARDLDATRPTFGVRCIEHSELLEDVYTMNDFIHGEPLRDGQNDLEVLRAPQRVTGLSHPVPYMVTEYNGHMFPTKVTDSEERQIEHVRRHIDVLDRAWGEPGIAGATGWCMFDYNTHKDFGSGDRICHHGVMDPFRVPKFAAGAYKSQVSPEVEPVLIPVTTWARGERAIGGVLPLMILTNCDMIGFRFGDGREFKVSPDRKTWPHLPHPPVIIDTSVVPPEEVGAWGMSWQDGTISGYVKDEMVITHRFVADPKPDKLTLWAESGRFEASARDEIRFVVTARDQAGNPLHWLDGMCQLEVNGPAKLIGPSLRTLSAGHVSGWLRSTGVAGRVELSAIVPRFEPVAVSLLAD